MSNCVSKRLFNKSDPLIPQTPSQEAECKSVTIEEKVRRKSSLRELKEHGFEIGDVVGKGSFSQVRYTNYFLSISLLPEQTECVSHAVLNYNSFDRIGITE